jgi:hypothetical protein
LNAFQIQETGAYRWYVFRNAGLCGSDAPRGVIFTLILKFLFKYTRKYPWELVASFCSEFSREPCFYGCLLKLQETLKLKTGHSIRASLLTCVEQSWIVGETIDLPPKGIHLNVLVYDEIHSKISGPEISNNSLWCYIDIPCGFDVIHAVLVDLSESGAIYGIQITRSTNPFVNHHTFDTCAQKSRERLNRLYEVIIDHFKLRDDIEMFYVIIAPNCKGDEFRPPSGHSSDYYFSPADIIPVENAKKRTIVFSLKKKCCRCRSGKCSNCKCFKENRECEPDCQCRKTKTKE